MANFSILKAAVADYIKNRTGLSTIDGEGLQQVLLSMITSLGANYQFVGFASPSTNPGTPDQNVFYLAFESGTYSNFNDTVINSGEIAAFLYNGSWTVQIAKTQNVGFYECQTPAATWVKAVTAPGYALMVGGAIKIKFAEHNEASTVYLNINSTGNKQLYYNGTIVDQYNSWKDGETVFVYYDGVAFQSWPLKQNIGIFDVSEANNGASYSHPGYAIAAIPSYVFPRPTTIRYIDSNTNKYVTYICTYSAFTADSTKWECLVADNAITPGSQNLVTGGSIYDEIQKSIIKKTDFINSGVVRSNGSITPGVGQYFYAKRAIRPGDTIYAEINVADTACAVAFFDSNNEIMPAYNIMGTFGLQKINTVAPSGAAWVYLCCDLLPASGNPDAFYIINYISLSKFQEITEIVKPISEMTFSQRCFDFGKKAPQKPCITITFDVLNNFSFGASKGLFDYISLLKNYGIDASSFFIRPNSSQIDSVSDFVQASKVGQDVCIHSIHTDSFGDNDTENPHPSLADAETILQNYQKWFKTNDFPYSLGWVTSRGALYPLYFPILEKYLAYAHTLGNLEWDSVFDDEDGINLRTGDKMRIIRVGMDVLASATSSDETTCVNRIKGLIDKAIELNGFLCLYGHGFDNMDAPYTMRQSVLTPILTYLKTKIDNFEILVGSEAEIVPYFYD